MGPNKLVIILAAVGTFAIGIIIFLIVRPYAFADTVYGSDDSPEMNYTNSQGQPNLQSNNSEPSSIERKMYSGDKDEEQLLYEEGRDLFEIASYEESMKKLKRLLRLYPKGRYSIAAHILLGRNYLARGIKNNHRPDIKKASDYLLENLKQALITREVDKATLAELVDFLVATSEANRRLGVANEEIEAHVEQLLLLVDSETRSVLITCLGFLKFHRDDFEGALRSFQQSNTELALVGKAKVYLELHEYEKALSIFDDFIKYHKDSEYYEEMLNFMQKHGLSYGKKLYRNKSFRQAYKVFESLNENFISPETQEEAIFYMGLCHWEVREFDLAIKWFNSVMENAIKIRDDDALFWKARSLVELNQMHQSLALFDRLLDFYQDTPYRNEALSWKGHLQREIEAAEELGSQPKQTFSNNQTNTTGATQIQPIEDITFIPN